MDQIQQLLELLKQTPEMAIYGLVIYFLFILLKLASWILALKIVAQQFIKRFFDYREKNIAYKQKKIANDKAAMIIEMFDSEDEYFASSNEIFNLFNALKVGGKICKHDIKEAIKKVRF